MAVVTYFLVLDVGCEECREPTEVIDICFEEDKARDSALKVAADRVYGRVRENIQLDEGPPYQEDHPEGQSCIAYWGPVQIHKVEALAPPETFGADYPRVASRDASGAPTVSGPDETGPR